MPKQRKKNQLGVTLIELMIAMVLGLMLTGGAIQIFISSKATYRSEDALSRLQETGRFIVDYMSKDIRMTGYMGCSSRTPPTMTVLANSPPNPAFDVNNALMGYDAGTGWTNPVNGTIPKIAASDVLTISRVNDAMPKLNQEIADNANIKIDSNPTNIIADEVVIVTDCVDADMIRTTNVSSAAGVITIAHANSANDFAGAGLANNKLSKVYGPDAFLMAFQQSTYFIGDTGRNDATGSDVPGLFVIPFEGDNNGDGVKDTMLLAENVEDMQILYGLDNGGGDDYADIYVSASTLNAADWADVRAIRLNLLLRSEEMVTTAPRDVTFAGPTQGTTVNVNNGDNTPAYDTTADRRLRMMYTSTITIRNRLP